MGGSRNAVERELNLLTAPGAELGKASPRATSRLYAADDFGRRRFQAAVIEQYLELDPDVEREGLAAVVTAGPPGAGKSTLLESHGFGGPGWRVVDADILKLILLEKAQNDGIYDDLLSRTLADGHPLLLNELAALVHAESARLARNVLHRALEERENVVIEGTLTWEGLGGEYIEELAWNDYAKLTILDVEVDQETALRQAGQRWWDGRTAAQSGTGDPRGGRFTPRDAITAAFPSPTQVSVCNRHATRLFNDPRARNFEEVRLIVADRAESRDDEYEFVSHRGIITGHWPMQLDDARQFRTPKNSH